MGVDLHDNSINSYRSNKGDDKLRHDKLGLVGQPHSKLRTIKNKKLTK